ncbi:MAG TPA: xanthine dehydrogenase family protein molybdopterin-binding subunit [Candidatus Saccharimonadales bacterium]|nr:xanthine dehydrogenase family protein molybdopterin-binding subunit [Candidatus Saccharimonadales bacterium]
MEQDYLKIVEHFYEKRNLHVVGKSVRRVGAAEGVFGRTKYTADYFFDRMLHVKVFRGTEPHALIKNVDTREAQKAPGVAAVLTAKDILGINDWGFTFADQPLLASEKVRFVGEGVALVAAESPEQAEEAAKLIQVDYQPLPAVFDPRDALRPDSPKVHDKGNVMFQCQVRKGDVAEGFRKSSVIVENEYTTQRQEHAYLDPEAAIGLPEPDGSVTVIAGMQSPFLVQMNVAKILGVTLDKVRVIQSATGGGFGGKDDVPPELCSRVALVATRTNRPAMLIHSREESIRCHNKRYPYFIKYKSGASEEGKLLASEVELISDTGAFASHGPYVLWRSAVHAAGPYIVPNVKVDAFSVYTNNLYSGSFRGFGNPQVQFAAESQIDELANKLGVDPVEFRLKNVLKDGSYTGTNQLLDHSVGVEECLRETARVSNWKDKRSGGLKNGVKRRGIGVALMYHGNSTSRGAPDYSAAYLMVNKDGSVRYRTGITEIGTGTHTGHMQIVAEILGIPMDYIHLESVDTSAVPDSGPTHASRGLARGGAAAMVAAYKAREGLNAIAAELLSCSPDDIEIVDAQAFSRRNPEKKISFKDLAREAYERGVNISHTGYFRAPKNVFDQQKGQGQAYANYTFASHVVEVEVDTETGEVKVLKVTPAYDIGFAINPLLIEGQIHGGIAQGLGLAVMENVIIENGVVRNPNLMDYLIPTSMDMPEIDKPILIEKAYRLGPFGAKGVAEPPLIAMPSAIANAVYDAINIRIRDLPITPERVLMAIKRSKNDA